eukprot:gene4041-4288_t
MAMEIIQVINAVHEDSIAGLAYNRVKKEIYTCADGDRAIKVWDLKTGQLLRTQIVHRGVVTALAYSSSAKLLFSASIDGSIGVWTDKGSLLQVVPTGWPVFSLIWDSKHQILVAGGNSVLHVFKDGLLAAMLEQGDDMSTEQNCELEEATAAVGSNDGAAAGSNAGAADTLSEAAGSTISGSKQKAGAAHGGNKASANDGMPFGCSRQREDDYYGVCHTDVVKCIVVTDAGKIFTAGFDRCICSYDIDKLDKPKEAFKRVRECGRAGLTSLAYDPDPHNSVLLTGSLDGTLRVWSLESRCLDKFEGLSNKPISAVQLPHVKHWWATGRSGKLEALDPRAPAVITQYAAQPNQLLDHAVDLLYAPPGSDLVLAGTTKRQLVVWQYNPHGAHRVMCGHEDWVEGLHIGNAGHDITDQRVFSFSADGHVCMWELDAEQNCDVYKVVEDVAAAECNVLCLLYLAEQQCIVCGCEDGDIRLHYLDSRMPSFAGDGSILPSKLSDEEWLGLHAVAAPGHQGKVSGLAELPDHLLLSCSDDRTLRVWDLGTMKQVHVEVEAHDSPIQCLEYCPLSKEAATSALGSKVKVWSFSKPRQPRLKLVLDHSEPDTHAGEQHKQGPAGVGPSDVNPDGTSDMQWLTRSDIVDGRQQGKRGPELPSIVAEAIAHAAEEVPEVTQVRWVGHKQCWITAADDEQLRMWSPAGDKLGGFAFKGGSCRFQGHGDVITGMGYLQALDCYVTSSWDKSLRLWRRPSEPAPAAVAGARAASASVADGGLLGEDSEDVGSSLSDYEKAHPLVMPKSLSQDHALALLQAIGVDGESAASSKAPAGGGRSAARRGGHELCAAGDDLPAGSPYLTEPTDPPGSLGAKLQELGRRLLQDINETASRVAAAHESPSGARPGATSMLQRNISSFSGIASAVPDSVGIAEPAAASRLKKGSGLAGAMGSRKDHN